MQNCRQPRWRLPACPTIAVRPRAFLQHPCRLISRQPRAKLAIRIKASKWRTFFPKCFQKDLWPSSHKESKDWATRSLEER